MTTTAEDVWQLLAELAAAQKETERLLREQNQETDRRIRELNQEIRRFNQQIGNLGGKWGRFVENMVAPACETLVFPEAIVWSGGGN